MSNALASIIGVPLLAIYCLAAYCAGLVIGVVIGRIWQDYP